MSGDRNPLAPPRKIVDELTLKLKQWLASDLTLSEEQARLLIQVIERLEDESKS